LIESFSGMAAEGFIKTSAAEHQTEMKYLLNSIHGRAQRNLFAGLCAFAMAAGAQQYDIVISGGRVIDPETHLDAVRDVGIVGGKIAAVSGNTLSGRTVVDAHH
jgi:hypothetical protein